MQDESAESVSSSVEQVDPLSALASAWTRMGTANQTPPVSATNSSEDIRTPSCDIRRFLLNPIDADPRVYSPEQYPSQHSFSPVVTQRSWTLDTQFDANLEDTPPSIIHDEARVCNWDNVLRLCNTHPHLAAYTSPRESQTALHHACDRRCPLPSVFESLITAFPEALVLTDQKGWTPLHCACRFKAPLDAVQILLHSFPDYGRMAAQEKCKVMGRIPLFYAIRYEAPTGVVELLLEYIQGVEDILEKDKVGMSILSLVWDSWATREGKPYLSPIVQQFDRLIHSDSLAKISGDNNMSSNQDAIPMALRQQLEKVELILQGAFHYRPGTRKWRFLHACAAMNCHLTLFMVACILYPEQASELDKDDLFFHSTMSNPEIQQTPNQQTALHLATKVHSQGVEARKVIIALLTLFPEAAAFRNPRDDCYPLHYLCKNESKVQWIQDGFRDVYEANKEAIYQGNYSNQLPLHLAASVARYRPSPVIATITKPAQHTQDAQNPLQQHSNMDAVGSIIQNLIEAYPESSRQLDHLGMHPFHYIAKNSELWTLDVEVLYMSYPQAIHTPTTANQNIPLHLAAGNMDARGDFIHALVKLYPGCAITNDEGKLPLHLACEVGKNWDEGVQYIYNAYNEALFTRAGKSGKLPIHFAAESKSCPKGLLAHLVERNMKSTIVKDSRGQTPLHLAIQSGKFWDDGLDILIDAGPDSMDIADNHGIVPFVLAALKHCNHTCRDDDDDDSIRSVETVFELLQRVPFILSHYI